MQALQVNDDQMNVINSDRYSLQNLLEIYHNSRDDTPENIGAVTSLQKFICEIIWMCRTMDGYCHRSHYSDGSWEHEENAYLSDIYLHSQNILPDNGSDMCSNFYEEWWQNLRNKNAPEVLTNEYIFNNILWQPNANALKYAYDCLNNIQKFLLIVVITRLGFADRGDMEDAKPIPFVKLIDSIVYHPNTSDPEILRLVDNINRRQHPKLVEAIVLPYKNDDPGTQKTIEETVTRLKDKYLTINRTTKQLTTKQLTTNNNNNDNVSSSEEKEYLDNYVFVTTIIGFAGKSTPNPLENVYFYNNNKRETTTTGNCVTTSAEENALKKTHQNYAYTLDLHRCSFIIPKFCKEAIIRVYKKTN